MYRKQLRVIDISHGRLTEHQSRWMAATKIKSLRFLRHLQLKYFKIRSRTTTNTQLSAAKYSPLCFSSTNNFVQLWKWYPYHEHQALFSSCTSDMKQVPIIRVLVSLQKACPKSTDNVQLESTTIDVDHSEALHELLRTPSTMAALNNENLPSPKIPEYLLAVSLSMYEVTSSSQTIENILSVLKHQKHSS